MSFPSKILITGASGFIGSFLTETALDKNFKVWAGIRESSNRKYLSDKRINFVDLQYHNKEKLEDQLYDFIRRHGKFDYIIHNAGVTKCLNSKDFDKINFRYTANLVDALITTGCIPKKFIFMSSLSVMGKGDEVNYTPFQLYDTPQPNTAYGCSKLKAENYIRQQRQIPYIIFRPTGVYGPREKDYLMMLKSIKSGLDIGAGFKTQHLTFIYIKDLAEVIFTGIESSLTNKTYFISDGDVYTDKEYTSIIRDLLNKKHVINLKAPLWMLKVISSISEAISHIIKKPSTLNRDKYIIMSQRNWECDIQPLIKDLNFNPKFNLKKGLRESIDWYKQHKWL